MNNSISKSKKILLVDAVGAVISALSLIIPYSFVDFFGMPQNAVSIFIYISIIYSIYSTTIYFAKIENWSPYLTIICLMNIGYCIFIGYNIFKNLNSITLYGYLYFVNEILIILTLAIVEFKISRRTTNR